MSDDIAEAKRVSFDIIDSKRGTQDEPSAYILVPFNDPGGYCNSHGGECSSLQRSEVISGADFTRTGYSPTPAAEFDECITVNRVCLLVVTAKS